MIHYFDASRLTAVDSICFHLNILLKKYVLPGQPVIVMCIGSDRSTGDSLGPIVGYKLSKALRKSGKKQQKNGITVYGTLSSPVHATNLESILSEIYFRKISPRTTCLYSAASMFPRRIQAASQISFSKPIFAVFSDIFYLPECGYISVIYHRHSDI